MSRPLVDEETRQLGISCATLDVEMAREKGWTTEDVEACWEKIASAVRAANWAVAQRRGHTRKCLDCECWTLPGVACHLCEQDRAR